MSDVAWIVLVALLTPTIAGIVAGAVIEPLGPWKRVFESAAAGAGFVVALLAVATIAVMVLYPANGHGDQEAAVQLIFVALLAVPLYAPALVGAAIGKLVARQLGRRQAG